MTSDMRRLRKTLTYLLINVNKSKQLTLINCNVILDILNRRVIDVLSVGYPPN